MTFWLSTAISKHKASQVSDIYHLRWLDQYLNGVGLQTIKRDLLDKISAAKQATGVENATVNRVLEVIRIILRCQTASNSSHPGM